METHFAEPGPNERESELGPDVSSSKSLTQTLTLSACRAAPCREDDGDTAARECCSGVDNRYIVY